MLVAVDFALAFDSPLSFSRILERLNELGPWSWRERDSAWYGNRSALEHRIRQQILPALAAVTIEPTDTIV